MLRCCILMFEIIQISDYIKYFLMCGLKEISFCKYFVCLFCSFSRVDDEFSGIPQSWLEDALTFIWCSKSQREGIIYRTQFSSINSHYNLLLLQNGLFSHFESNKTNLIWNTILNSILALLLFVWLELERRYHILNYLDEH